MFKITPEGHNPVEMDIWGELYEAKEIGTPLEVLIVRIRRITGQGETWEVEFPQKPNITGLIPKDETGLPENFPMNAFIGQKISIKVRKIDKRNNLVACSRKDAVGNIINKLINQVEENETINALVRVVTEQYVYVDIGGGVMLKIPQNKARLSYGTPLNIQYKINSIIQVKITALDKANKNIEVEPLDPWEQWEYARGEVVLGKVVAIKDTHVYIGIKPGMIGLASHRYIGEYKIGDRIEFQVDNYDRQKRHLRLKKWDAKRTIQRRQERGRIFIKRTRERNSAKSTKTS